MLPAGAVADDAIVMVDDRLLLVPLEGRRTLVENLGSMPVADVDVAGGAELASGPGAAAAFDSTLDDWLTLTETARDHLAPDSLLLPLLAGNQNSAHTATLKLLGPKTSETQQNCLSPPRSA